MWLPQDPHGSPGSPFQVTPLLTFLPVLHKRSEMHICGQPCRGSRYSVHTPPQAGPLGHLRQALKAGSESCEWEILGFYMLGACLWGGAGVLQVLHGDIALALPTFHTSTLSPSLRVMNCHSGNSFLTTVCGAYNKGYLNNIKASSHLWVSLRRNESLAQD